MQLLWEMHDSRSLVNLVDNDYKAGNCLFDLLDELLSARDPSTPDSPAPPPTCASASPSASPSASAPEPVVHPSSQ